MMSAADLRNELRALRKEQMKPVSRMSKGDVSAEIQRLKVAREETPLPAATNSARERVPTVPTAMAQDSTFEKVGGTKKGMPRKTARKAYEEVAEAPKAAPKAKAKAAPKAKAKAAPKAAPAPAAPAKKGRPAKGSEEAKAHMARIRAMRKKKEE